MLVIAFTIALSIQSVDLSEHVDDLVYDALNAESLLDNKASSTIGKLPANDVCSAIYDAAWFKH